MLINESLQCQVMTCKAEENYYFPTGCVQILAVALLALSGYLIFKKYCKVCLTGKVQPHITHKTQSLSWKSQLQGATLSAFEQLYNKNGDDTIIEIFSYLSRREAFSLASTSKWFMNICFRQPLLLSALLKRVPEELSRLNKWKPWQNRLICQFIDNQPPYPFNLALFLDLNLDEAKNKSLKGLFSKINYKAKVNLASMLSRGQIEALLESMAPYYSYSQSVMHLDVDLLIYYELYLPELSNTPKFTNDLLHLGFLGFFKHFLKNDKGYLIDYLFKHASDSLLERFLREYCCVNEINNDKQVRRCTKYFIFYFKEEWLTRIEKLGLVHCLKITQAPSNESLGT